MADIRCSSCGKINPDFLDVCQFCQAPLKPEAMLHIGEHPTKKNTGELEPILPEWLRSIQKQAKDSAEEDAVQAESSPKAKKEEPPDLLAGLAFQSENSDEEEVPDWLSTLSGTPKSDKPAPSTPVESGNDFFAQFNKSEPTPNPEPAHEEEESPSWMSRLSEPAQQSSENDDLSDWLAKASDEPAKPFSLEPELSQIDSGWEIKPEVQPVPEQPAPKEPEDLGWLHTLEAESKKTGELPTPNQATDWFAESSPPSSGQDDLSWLNTLGGIPAPEQPQPVQQPSEPRDDLGWLNDLGTIPSPSDSIQKPPGSNDDLSWLRSFDDASTSEQPAQQPAESKDEPGWLSDFGAVQATNAQQPAESKDDLSWLGDFGTTPPTNAETPAESKDDLGWLGDFGAAPPTNAQQPAESKDDLSWLNDFGATPTSNLPAQQPAESKDDLSWLSDFGGTPSSNLPAQQPAESTDDLSWLNSFGSTPEQPSQPASQPQDLSWLNSLSETSQAGSVTSASNDDLNLLNNLRESPSSLSSMPFSESSLEQDQAESGNVPDEPVYTPRQTARLNPDEEISVPDWLRSATEGHSMPVNAAELDQFREDFNIPSAPEQPFSWKNVTQGSNIENEETSRSKPERAFVDLSSFGSGDDTSALSNKDVDSLFSVDMPDWLSRPATGENETPSDDIGIHAEGGEALSPVDLPSWVQAMRPVEAVMAETAAVEDLPTEQDGPLAGFKGVIPAVPIGSSRRPQPIALKLQATDEQQTSAAIMEQILVSEISPRALLSTAALASQRTLRQVLAVLVWVLLSAVIFMRTQIMPISPVLPPDVDAASRTLDIIPDGSSVLVVLDYAPSLAGEMEAASGPLLNHLVLLRHPRFSFISTSPNGAGLVDRLMKSTKVSTTDGLGYRAGQNYFNLGYLPGGESGILAFIQSPQSVSSLADPSGFSQYAAIIMLTDHADSARAWVEQLQTVKQIDPALANQPLLVVSSAQAGPMLQPYVTSRQINGLITGLADAARYEHKNNVPPGMARSYWDAFGVGVILAVTLIVLGSLWSLMAGMRARRAEAGEE